jgi:hypothetical protein
MIFEERHVLAQLRMQSLPSVSTLTAIWVLMNFTASFFANWNLSVVIKSDGCVKQWRLWC